MYKRAVNPCLTKQLVCDIKTKKSLKYLPVHNPRVGKPVENRCGKPWNLQLRILKKQ